MPMPPPGAPSAPGAPGSPGTAGPAGRAGSPASGRPSRRRRYLWLAAGTAVSLFAVHGNWDIPLAAWVYAVFLLRFTRTGGAAAGTAWMVGVASLGLAFWFWQADVFSPPMLLLAAALALIEAVPFVLDRLAAPRLARRGALAASLVFPAATAATEFLTASLSPLGTIYGVLGGTQHGNLPLIQIASVTGVYGVSFLVAWFAAVAAHAWETGWGAPRTRRLVVVYTAVLALVLSFGGARLGFAPPSSPTVRVAGVTLAEETWDTRVSAAFTEFDSLEAIVAADRGRVREVFAPIHDELLRATEREARAGARLVVWSESAAHTREEDKGALLEQVAAVAREHRVYVQIGVSVYIHEKPYMRNQTVLVTPEGETAWTYDKAHPIPVLEPYDAGSGETPVADTPFGRLATAICYDVDFPQTLRQAGAQGAGIVLLPSNEWEGIRKLHAERALFRAVEGGFSLVRPVNRGQSTAVDHQGRTIATTDYFDTGEQAMVAEVPTAGATTVYSRVGDLFSWLCLAGLLVLLALAARSRARRHGG
ncbi:apolipoprotein N-acyltransferase [Streptomonospora nanhaiensis]|uniref:Apolipoprotein N-acyltransferase n=1 Tax=Streptomonospora nanhaiensis TaxID=1323731 RepID=A0A853BNZ7_9ACTN|nr:nitrilase-related carbon-nitrogen hydrolase [Streptomonospora nanhaiensis]NYI96241.1 apolipoprotein N-acyltransferase [Streptomonospora nanhaiensis]